MNTTSQLAEILDALIAGDEEGADAIAAMTPEEFAAAFGDDAPEPAPDQ